MTGAGEGGGMVVLSGARIRGQVICACAGEQGVSSCVEITSPVQAQRAFCSFPSIRRGSVAGLRPVLRSGSGVWHPRDRVLLARDPASFAPPF